MRAAPWQVAVNLIEKISHCASCGAAAVWCLVSEDTAFAFCGPCCCRWSHPSSPVMDEDDLYQACPECSKVEIPA
jgi:transcription elongation factor Elf1